MAPRLKAQRQLAYNFQSENTGDPSVNHWTFVIVNAPRETRAIIEGLRQQLVPTDSERVILDKSIKGSNGVHVTCIQIDSYQRSRPAETDLNRVYSGKLVRDKILGTHRGKDGLSEYVEREYAQIA